jgi:hypothetical protein
VVKSRGNDLRLKKNKFKDFPTNVILKNLDRRSRFNTLQKAGMLQYFDEEFEDFKFPVNNEFFFLQVAYGSAFLSRQYQRSKSIELQKDSYAIVKAYRKKLFKLRNRVRLNRSLLFFFFIKNNM